MDLTTYNCDHCKIEKGHLLKCYSCSGKYFCSKKCKKRHNCKLLPKINSKCYICKEKISETKIKNTSSSYVDLYPCVFKNYDKSDINICSGTCRDRFQILCMEYLGGKTTKLLGGQLGMFKVSDLNEHKRNKLLNIVKIFTM